MLAGLSKKILFQSCEGLLEEKTCGSLNEILIKNLQLSGSEKGTQLNNITLPACPACNFTEILIVDKNYFPPEVKGFRRKAAINFLSEELIKNNQIRSDCISKLETNKKPIVMFIDYPTDHLVI